MHVIANTLRKDYLFSCSEKMKKVRIVIIDVYRNSKYDDTPISKLMFFNVTPG